MKLELYSSWNHDKTKCKVWMTESNVENSYTYFQIDTILNHWQVYYQQKKKKAVSLSKAVFFT